MNNAEPATKYSHQSAGKCFVIVMNKNATIKAFIYKYSGLLQISPAVVSKPLSDLLQTYIHAVGWCICGSKMLRFWFLINKYGKIKLDFYLQIKSTLAG